MKKLFLSPVKIIVLATALFFCNFIYSQDSARFKPLSNVTLSISPVHLQSGFSEYYFLYHSPGKKDISASKRYAKLIYAEPTEKNHSNYYSLACSLWELDRLDEAENMFLKIESSQEPYYSNTIYYSSDVRGDTSKNTYGYGSYSFNYKNNACRYLARIYIEKRRFDEALRYIEYADKKYVIQYNCGTGNMWYREEIEGMYALTYEGLRRYYTIIDLFLPNSYHWNNPVLTRTLRTVYTKQEIRDHLEKAIQSVVFVADTTLSYASLTNHYSPKNQSYTQISYLSGTATIELFGKKVELPRPNLKNGESATKELYIKNFEESDFYRRLTLDEL